MTHALAHPAPQTPTPPTTPAATMPMSMSKTLLAARDRPAGVVPLDADASPDVSVVILNYRVRDLLLACLDSVAASTGKVSYEVIVVDNNSDDGSADAVAAAFPWVRLIRAPRNGGYAWGNNLGLRAARGRCLLLLNPDTVVPPDALATTWAYLRDHPDVGVVGPRLVRPDGRLDLACRRGYPTPGVALAHMLRLPRLFPRSARFGRYNLTHLDPGVETDVDAVAGAYMAVRREAVAMVGLLDERYFMYGEDLDWARRLTAAGWRVRYLPSITVVHHKGESSRRAFTRANAAFYRAMLLFHRVHYAPSTPAPLNALIVAGVYLRWGLAKLTALIRPRGLRRVGAS